MFASPWISLLLLNKEYFTELWDNIDEDKLVLEASRSLCKWLWLLTCLCHHLYPISLPFSSFPLCLFLLFLFFPFPYRCCNCCSLWGWRSERNCVYFQWKVYGLECDTISNPSRPVGCSEHATKLWLFHERSHRYRQKWLSRWFSVNTYSSDFSFLSQKRLFIYFRSHSNSLFQVLNFKYLPLPVSKHYSDC